MKVQLSAAYYDVVLASRVDGVLEVARSCRPDLVLTANALPDGSAADVKKELRRDDALADVPVIAVSRTDNPMRRLEALSAGIDDVLPQPLDDVILQARIRSLLRARSANEELNMQRDASHGFILPLTDRAAAAQTRPASIALVAEDIQTARDWKKRLSGHVRHDIRTHQIGDIQPLMSDPVADVFIIELNETTSGAGLRLLADLRARATTRQSVVIAVPNPGDPHVAAEALDRGAHDVLQTGFNVEELALRLNTQLQYKHRHDLLRASVRNGLRAAVEDSMTGLYNRRYAKPFLDRTARSAAETGDKFALMLADLDHFKQINDRYGHPAGDAVLIEAARRLQAHLRPVDLLARVGGEEFMVVLPGADELETGQAAVALCNAINSRPFKVPGVSEPIAVTISIGAVIGGGTQAANSSVTDLIAKADQALYNAKNAGRNRAKLSDPDTAVA